MCFYLPFVNLQYYSLSMKKLLLLIGLCLAAYTCSKGEDNSAIAPIKYTVSVSATSGGSVSTSGGEYNENTSVTYFSQRGNTDHLDKFHLWMQSPWFSDDNLLEIVSGSFNKNTFRTILSSSPVSSSLVPLFNTSSFTDNINHPDFVAKNPTLDSGIQSNSVKFYSYNANSSSYQNEIDSGSLVEQYIIQSGSYEDGKSYLDVGKI